MLNRFLYSWLIIFFLGGCNTPTENVTTINIWHQMLYENRKILREVCDVYELEHPDIHIELTYRETEELRANFQSSAMGGSGPELIYGPSDQVGPFSVMGIIQPLDTVFSSSFFDEFVNNAIVKLNGKTWMIGDVVGNHLMLIYNKSLMDSPPQNTDELIEMGKALTKDTNGDDNIDQYGLVWNFTEPFFYAPWLGGFGEWLITDDAKPNLDTDANRQGFKFIKSLRDEHKIIPKECDYEIANALFKTGKAAMIINGDWSWGDYKDVVDFDIAPLPKVSSTGLWPTPMVSTKGYSINVNTTGEKLKYTKSVLTYLTSPEVQLYFTQKVSSQPSSKVALKSDIVKNNDLLNASAVVIEKGRPMPVVPEMRAIWDALRTQYQAVLGGNIDVNTAAILSHENSIKQIALMNEIREPNFMGKLLKWIMLVLVLSTPFYFRKHIREFVSGLKENSTAYWFILPAFTAVFAVVIFPFLYNVVISVSNFSLRTFRDWDVIGFHHYMDVFKDPFFYSILGKTVLWTATNLFFHVSLGVLLAILINRTLPAKRSLRTLLIIPWAVPQYISALSWRGMFNQEYGSINLVLTQYLNMDAIQWLSQPFQAFTACLLTNIWLGFPFMMVIALGGLQSIPRELYEAARVDGASRFQQFTKITLPMLKPVMMPAIILGMIWTFNNINVVWLVSNGGEPSDQTHILVSFVYKAAFNLYRYGYAAALSMVIFMILLTVGILSMNKSKSTENMYS